MKKNIAVSVLPFMLLLLVACEKETQQDKPSMTDNSSAYFPLDSGLTRIYQVDSIYWDPFTGINDTVSYLLKEVVADEYIDNEGRFGRRLERYKQNGTGDWIIFQVRAALKLGNRGETVENNIRYVRIIFPLNEGDTWDINAYNALGNQEGECIRQGTADAIGPLSFSNTCWISGDDEPATLIGDRFAEERYAVAIGPYYKILAEVETNIISGDTTSGYVYTEKLISYQP